MKMRRVPERCCCLLAVCWACVLPTMAGAQAFVWPTEMVVRAETPWQSYVQAAASGKPETGLYGTARNNGDKFHEGLDIRASRRDRRGEALDAVCVVAPGTVAHVVPSPNGPYGRYVVVLHQQGKAVFYTLYAHLASVEPGLRVGQAVQPGQKLGVLGRSDGGRGFPKERAHLHFEVGLRLSDDFDAWYARQKDFSTPNRHGLWNGRNLLGTDPVPFLQAGLAAGNAPDYLAMVLQERTAVTVQVATTVVPDFLRRYPSLCTTVVPARVAGWRIEFAWHGMPVRWTPLLVAPGGKTGKNSVTIEVAQDLELQKKSVARDVLLRQRNGTLVPGKSLQDTLAMLFGW